MSTTSTSPAAAPSTSSRSPRTKLDLPAGEDVTWTTKSYGGLKGIVERAARALNLIRHGLAEELISVWWAAPEEEGGKATLGIGLDEFTKNAYTEGHYYVRVAQTHDAVGEQVVHYTCKAALVTEAAETMAGALRLERALSNGLDTLEGLNAKLADSAKVYIEEADALRRLGHEKDGRIAALEREVGRLEGELADEQQNNADIFDEATGEAILQVVQMWAANPNGPASTALARLLGANLKLFLAMQGDPSLMAHIIPNGTPVPWLREFADEFNAIASANDAKGPTGAPLALLPRQVVEEPARRAAPRPARPPAKPPAKAPAKAKPSGKPTKKPTKAAKGARKR